VRISVSCFIYQGCRAVESYPALLKDLVNISRAKARLNTISGMAVATAICGLLLAAGGLVASINTNVNASAPPYKNPNLPVAERVSDLLGRMTIEDKMAQLMQGRWLHSSAIRV
jgi:hypothetical protein